MAKELLYPSLKVNRQADFNKYLACNHLFDPIVIRPA
jgi:hypothetical protein